MDARKLTSATTAKLQKLLVAPAFDRVAWDAIVADDLHLRIGNAAPAIGRGASLAELSHFLARTKSIGTGFCETCRRRETLFAEMDVEFIDAAGHEQRIPCVVAARMASGSLVDLRFHLDPSPIP
jgi:hypothetical protein